MPNLRGPSEEKRRLYSHVVLATLLYVAPVWHEALTATSVVHSLQHVQKCMALRVIAAYRTVSFDAATLLAKTLPVQLLAGRVFRRIRDSKKAGAWTLRGERERSGRRRRY